VFNPAILCDMNTNGHIPQILLIVFGVLSIYIAFKIAHFVLKVVLHLIGLALLGGAVWWFFFRK
jgi:hypothetical protein